MKSFSLKNNRKINIIPVSLLAYCLFATLIIFSGFWLISPNRANAATLQTLRPVSNNLGLIGLWSLDGADVTDKVYDRSGQGNHAGLNGAATSSAKTSGRIGQALSFDGSNDYIDIPDIIEGLSTMTVSIWVKNEDLSGATRRIFKQTGGGADPIELSFSSGSGSNDYKYQCTVETTSLAENTPLSAQYRDTDWHHVVCIYDGSNIKLYIDGELSGTSAGITGLVVTTTNNLTIGSSGTDTWKGKIDDARIYNRALSAIDVKRLYNSGMTNGNSSRTSSMTSGLVGMWSFDGADVTDKVYDRSGRGNHGGFVGGATSSAKIIGKIGQALRFDGSSTYVNIPDTSDVEGQSALSISVWVKNDNSENVSGSDSIITKEGSGADTFYLSWAQAEDIEFCIVGTAGTSCGGAGAASAVFTDGIPIGRGKEWYHIVGTYDSVAGQVKVYVNGVLGDTVGSLSALTQNSSHSIKIGNISPIGWPGMIDDVRIYNRALSVSEIKQLYNMGGSKINKTPTKITSGLIGHWTFDGAHTSSTIADSSGQGNNGYFLGGATSTAKTIGKIGQAFKFDGVDDRVKIANIIASNTSNLTVSFWMKSNTTANPGVPLSKSRAAAETTGSWGFSRNSGGQMQFYVTNSTPTWNQATKNGYADTLWHHVVGTFDGSNVRIYVDGQAGTSAALSGTIQTASSYPVCIGSNNADSGGTCNGDEFNGIVDDVRIFNRTLSETEIKQLYNMGR